MARVGSTGVLELFYAPVVADKLAPTTGELGSGVDLTPWLTRDGLSTPRTGNTLDVAGVDSLYNATARGSFGGDPISVTLFRDNDSDNDDGWDTLTDITDGFLVVFRFGTSGESGPADGDRCEVWPIEVISRSMQDIANDTAQRFQAQCAVPVPPADSAVVGGAGS